METFRCPTCIGVLPDEHARRCTACGQGLRRRHPRVLGEEHRLGAATLPIDRWMLERLHGEGRRRRRPRVNAPVAWHGRFAPSPRSAEPDLVLPPVVEPPAASTLAPTEYATPVADPEAPATVSALDLGAFVAPAPKPVVAHEELDPEVRSLVDDLYDQARSELAGFESPSPPPQPAAPRTSKPPPAAPQASATRSGWVPAFTTEQERRFGI